jgi:hypothetical protein
LPESKFLHSLHHAATKIKADLKATPGHHEYHNLSRTAAERCVPDSLYTLVKWMITGNSDCNTDYDESEIPHDIEHVHQNIMHGCETFVFNCSNVRMNTPKHIGIGLLIHHGTRSKLLIDHLHSS